LRLEFEDSIGRGLDLVGSLDDETLRRRPAPDAWCAADCLEHLSVTMEVYQRRIRTALDESKLRPARQKEEMSLLGRIVLRVVEPPASRKFHTPSGFAPGPPPERGTLLRRFDQTHRAMIRLIEETDPIDRMHVKIAAHGSEHFRLPLFDTFAILAAHDRRHLWQAERAAQLPLPSAARTTAATPAAATFKRR
jgi:hypothetical protein